MDQKSETEIQAYLDQEEAKKKSLLRPFLIFGIQPVSGGDYELDIDPVDPGSAFEELLANVVAIEPNPWFKTVTALADHVAGNRRGVTN